MNRDAELAMARRHVQEGEERIVQQEALLARLAEQGLPTGLARDLLDTFRASLAQEIDHLRLIEAEVAQERRAGYSRTPKHAPSEDPTR